MGKHKHYIHAMLQAIFVVIHPLIDGNGRTSRLLLNLELMKLGYPPIILRVENRLAYYNALDDAHTTEDYGDFVELVAKEVGASLDLYLSAVSDIYFYMKHQRLLRRQSLMQLS